MKRIDLGDIGNIAEAVAAIGVIVSLIYLGVQIQQNTNAIRASSYQSIADDITEFQMGLAQNGDLARIYLVGLENPQQLTPIEKAQLDNYLGVLFARFDTAVELYNRGMIDDRAMAPYSRFILFQLEFPGVAAYWQDAQIFFSDGLRDHIESIRRSGPE
ncbi:MAG: hypothetical protein JSV89_08850 [Spirochaetaceae bacterium]|nr:MAG: hypothetical protein JSV89_08850 [Spirochaetaceae bacterium]